MSARQLAAALIPFALIIILVVYITGPGADVVTTGTPLPEITLERIDFVEGEVQVTVRNTGPLPVNIVQGDVNDRIQPAAVEPDGYLTRFETALVRIPYSWNPAEPYTLGITIQDGTRFERLVEAAAPAVILDIDRIGEFALVGTYIGIIPVFIGLMWLPFIRRLDKNMLSFFLALTLGLLIFLGIDTVEEAVEISKENLSPSMNSALMIFTVAAVAFLALQYTGSRLGEQRAPLAAALFISIGIGLHNFGEGLALGAALNLGSAAFSAYLMAGFAIHNTTEGIAIASPLASQKRIISKLIIFGMIAGAPAIFGVWTGGFFYSPLSATIFLAVGAGAIFQVTYSIFKWIGNVSTPHICGGMTVGIVIMYVTSIIV